MGLSVDVVVVGFSVGFPVGSFVTGVVVMGLSVDVVVVGFSVGFPVGSIFLGVVVSDCFCILLQQNMPVLHLTPMRSDMGMAISQSGFGGGGRHLQVLGSALDSRLSRTSTSCKFILFIPGETFKRGSLKPAAQKDRASILRNFNATIFSFGRCFLVENWVALKFLNILALSFCVAGF